MPQTNPFMLCAMVLNLTSMLIHPRIDGGIAFESRFESQQFRSHRRSIFAFGSMSPGTPRYSSFVARRAQVTLP